MKILQPPLDYAASTVKNKNDTYCLQKKLEREKNKAKKRSAAEKEAEVKEFSYFSCRFVFGF